MSPKSAPLKLSGLEKYYNSVLPPICPNALKIMAAAAKDSASESSPTKQHPRDRNNASIFPQFF